MASVALIVLPPLAASQSSSPVIQLLVGSRDVRTRLQAAVTLGRLRPPGARSALESALSDSNAAVRAAAAESLSRIGDPLAIAALRAHTNDRDPGVRSGIARALQALEATVAMNAPREASPSVGIESASAAISAVDWQHVRWVVRVGAISNRAGGRAAAIGVLRNAIVQEVSHTSEIAVADGTLPPEAERRLRTGRMRLYSLEGSINTLRRWTVATTMSVRAEVSLVLMTEQSRAIIGSLSGAATAQQHTPYYDAELSAQRLEDRALSAAVRGALGNLQQSLSSVR